MEKEKLLAYFQTHYLSRQEVLFKLPLNHSIGTFWPELLDRRKARATVLPLYNIDGMPYWYVLTERMVRASERLCEEALSCGGEFDPYRMQMTGAMTEEMFFTSFVEGAQITLEEAMDFLQRGSGPENIQEQMIANNRNAWEEMTKTLYRPLDEGFVKGLAYILTEGMDGCAEDYRQSDGHTIAAMNDEPYSVPPGAVIPEMMFRLYTFLGQPNMHPLIKAAVAQAYLLVIRPFPEGNERLSRMISSAVLLRCGYDLFRNVSISSVIARESYRYYKAMREIIRTENGGDLTYFAEYYLELLVRALNARKEREERRGQQALERERYLAKMPLERAADDTVTGFERSETEVPDPGTEESSPAYGINENKGVRSGELMPLEQYLAVLDGIKTKNGSVKYPDQMRAMIEAGYRTFTVDEWAGQLGLHRKYADQECRTLYQKGLLDKDKNGRVMTYSFRFDHCGDIARNAGIPLSGQDSTSTAKTGSSPPGIIREYTEKPEGGVMDGTDENRHDIVKRLEEMRDSSVPGYKRIGWFLLTLLDQQEKEFDYSAYTQAFEFSKSVVENDLRRALNMGLIKKKGSGNVGMRCRYELCSSISQGTRTDIMTPAQKSVLSRIYNAFGVQEFTVSECAEALAKKHPTVLFHLQHLIEQELIGHNGKTGLASRYSLLITPKTHPDCFLMSEEEKTPGWVRSIRRIPAVTAAAGD